MDAFAANPWSTEFTSYAPYASTSSDFSVYPSPPLHKLAEPAYLSPQQPALRHAKSCSSISHTQQQQQQAPMGVMLTPTSIASSSPAFSDLQTPSVDSASPGFLFNNNLSSSPITPTGPSAYSQPMQPTSSLEEVSAFLSEMNSLLGDEAMAQFSTPPRKASSYNVSGVILDEDEYAAYNNNSSPTAPYGVNQQYNAYGYQQQQQAYYAPGPSSAPYGQYRRQSAPASPDLGAAFGYNGSWNYSIPAPVRHQSMSGPVVRRGSSLEALQAQSSRSDVVGMGFYLPHQTPPQQQVRRKASLPNPRSLSRKQSVAGGLNASAPKQVKKKASGTCFINFSKDDASTLLSGVAPSGSSKRKRDDDSESTEKKARV